MSKALYDKHAKFSSLNDLDDRDCNKIAQVINPLIADVFALYLKTKNFHWHMSGKHFRDYHLLLDEQADQVLAMIDVLAERVRKLGKTTIHSISHISQLQKIQDNNKDFVEPREMINELMNDNKNLLISMRSAHQICDQGNDVATASLLENYIDETEKRIWFLFETDAN
jgi:starvation-inducible DNA-binding protein